jgi:hypothetical protein
MEGTANEDTYVVTEWLNDLQGKPSHMVVKSGWKLMLPDPSAKKLKTALYNLNDDPHELKNLLANNADSNKYTARVTELEACFRNWMKRTSQNKL